MRKTTPGKVSFPQNEGSCHGQKAVFRRMRETACQKEGLQEEPAKICFYMTAAMK